jgi:hypothetical protein
VIQTVDGILIEEAHGNELFFFLEEKLDGLE